MTPEELKAIIDGVTAKVAPAATAPAATAGWTDQARNAQRTGGATRVPRKPAAPVVEPKTLAEAKAQIAELRASRATISLKVAEKGGLSVYGLGRFPVTLYKEQWDRLLDAGDAIRAFMVTNAARLTVRE